MGKDSDRCRRSGAQCLKPENNWMDIDSDADDDVFSDDEVMSNHSSVAERLGILHAIYQNDHNTFVDMLDSGVDPNMCDCDGNPLLHIVIENGNNEMMDYLLRDEHCDVNRENNFHQTPLIIAVIMDDFQMVKALVKAGADVNRTDSTGKTALLISLQESRSDIALYLIKHGSDVNVVDRLGQSALYIIIESMDLKCVKTVKKLLKAGYDLQKDAAWMKEEGLDVDIVKSGNWMSKLARKLASKLHTLKSSQHATQSPNTGLAMPKSRVLTIYQ